MNAEIKILIVEDDTALLSMLSKRLAQESWRPFTAENGKDGLEIALKEKPDLILLDLLMPVMNGVDVLRNLRADTWGKEVRVIVFTNNTNLKEIQEVEAYGATYLVKSDFSLEDIVTKIKTEFVRN